MRKGISTILIVSLTVVIMATIAAALYYFILMPKNQNTASNKSSENNSTQPESAKALVPYLIYAETVSEVNTNERSWPTISLYRLTNGADKELLATVGKQGEYPGRFALSPDHTKLLISLETKLQLLDLKTKKLTDLIVAEHEIGDSVFSGDGKSVLIWDQKYTGDKNYTLHRYNIETMNDAIVKNGTLGEKPQYLTPYAWRDDNKVAMMEPLGEAVDYWYFDLQTLEIKQTSLPTAGFASAYGNLKKLVAIPASTTPDLCNEMSGSAPDGFDILDDISGAKSGRVSAAGNFMTPVTFSSDDSELLYFTQKPGSASTECTTERTKTYYKANIVAGTSSIISNVAELLKEWHVDYIGADYSSSADGKTNNILINGSAAVTSTKSLQMIGQYWK